MASLSNLDSNIKDRYDPSADVRVRNMSQGRMYMEKSNKDLRTKLWGISPTRE